MTEFERVLIKRDGLTEDEAKLARKQAMEDIEEMIAFGDYDSVEDILAGDYGLEMDYIFDLI